MKSTSDIHNSSLGWLWGALLTVGLAGCAGYQLGPVGGQRAGATSIQVTPFTNQTIEPRLGDAITASLRKRLQQDGTYHLNTRGDGDIVVTGTILNYDRGQLTFQPGDIISPRDYRLTITAQITARERATGRAILDRKVTGQSTVRIGADQTSAERQAIPLVADDLARRAALLLVEGSW